MKISNITDSFFSFWNEFKKIKSGIFGLILFLMFVLIVIFEPLLLSFRETNNVWRDITYWEDLPKNAPPQWINLFTSKKNAVTVELDDPIIVEEDKGKIGIWTCTFEYDYSFYYPPKDIIFRTGGTGQPMLVIDFIRPDGVKITLYQKPVDLDKTDQLRISINSIAKDATYNFISKYEERENIQNLNKNLIAPTDYIFLETSDGFTKNNIPLNGKYEIKVTAIAQKALPDMDNPLLVIPGRVSGMLGTDSFKHDLWSGVIAGVKWALLIGLLTAVVSVSIGVIYGVIAAYIGGWADSLMMRIFEIFVSTPLLPVLIVLAAVFKPSIWTMIFMMCAFFWTGSVKTVRSMALQIKEETFIEASKAAGASNFRIIFKHMVPLLIPYSFASMALFIPGAIVYEASISLLGLGDATIVTWGQILSDAYNSGAMLSGIWWWVVPPGLCIALMGMAFAFIGFAADKILHPKLRTR